MYPIEKMQNHDSDGSEYCKTNEEKQILINHGTYISKTNCEYCNVEILAVWDQYNKDNWFPFLGCQAKKPNVYKYSPIIQTMRKFDNAEGIVWSNHLLNVHARCHSKDWSLRLHKNSIKLLCNECFQRTYNRVQVRLNNGIICAISVVPSIGETVDSVMKDLDLEGEVLGKGGEY